MTLTPCADCDRPALKMFGTLSLCEEHAGEMVDGILERRPDLRVPTLMGSNAGEPATWRCGVCGAGWFAAEAMPCPWCEERPELDHQIQASIDRGRLDDYLRDVAEGSQTALEAALGLVRVAVPRGTLPKTAIKQISDAWKAAE